MNAEQYHVVREYRSRTLEHGTLVTDATGQVKTRPVYALRGPNGKLVNDFLIREKAEAEQAAEELNRREEEIEAKHVPGWVACPCPRCQSPTGDER